MWRWTSRRLSMRHFLDVVFVFWTAEIGFADALVARNFVRAARRQNLALRHHGDVFGNFKHDTHVMLDDDDVDFARQLFDLFNRTFGFGRAHTAGRLVEKQTPPG